MKTMSRRILSLSVIGLLTPVIANAQQAIVLVDDARAGAKSVLTMDEAGSSRTEIFRTERRLGEGGPALSPAISPDGEWVSYVYQEDPLGPAWAIWKASAQGSDPQIVLCSAGPTGGVVVLETPQWSPKGSEIAAISVDYESGVQSVVIFPAAGLPCGEQPSTVYSSTAFGISPGVTWSADGTHLAVLETIAGTDHLTVIPRFEGAVSSYSISWPADFLENLVYKENGGLDWQRSSSLTFALDTYSESATQSGHTVWLLEVVDNSALVSRLADGASPSWSPDGSALLFGGPQGLTRLSLSGGETENLGPGYSPDWSRLGALQPCSADADCDDGDVCTTDTCDAGLCAHAPSYATCDDGNECTTIDGCDENGGCSGDLVAGGTACSDGFCCGGLCSAPECVLDVDCDDYDVCTIDTCAFNSPCTASCVHEPSSDPACACLPVGAECGSNDECCSGRCHPAKGCR